MASMAQQSPIDLRDPIQTDYGPNQLSIDWTENVRGTIHHDPKHGVKIVFGAQQGNTITLDQKLFHLVELHFHNPSEHWIAGQQQVLELHMVHQNIHDGTRAVLGIFIDADSAAVEATAELHDLLASIDAAVSAKSRALPPVVFTNPRLYLPRDTKHYYRYEGSLTTPDYDEDVSWAVVRDIKRFPKPIVDEMIRLFHHSARLPRPLNRRFVLANF